MARASAVSTLIPVRCSLRIGTSGRVAANRACVLDSFALLAYLEGESVAALRAFR